MMKTCSLCNTQYIGHNYLGTLCDNCFAGHYPVKYKFTLGVSKPVGVKPMPNAWKQKWSVIGTSGKYYTVAIREDGVSWGCTCPAHKFQPAPKKDCQHILAKKLELTQVKSQVNAKPVNQTDINKVHLMEYDVIKLLKAGEMILAIKYVRGIMGWSLFDAKMYMDKIKNQYVPEYNTIKSVYSPVFPTIDSILGKKSEPKVFKEPTGRKFKELD